MTNSARAIRSTLASRSIDLFPRDVAALLEEREPDEIAEFLQTQDALRAAAVLTSMRTDIAGDVVAQLSDDGFRAVLPHTDPAQSARWLVRLDEVDRQRRLDLLDRPLAAELGTIFSYPVGTAGALMDPRFTAARATSSVREAVASLQRTRGKRIHQLPVVDAGGKLVGAVQLADLALADPTTPVADLVRETSSITDTASRAEIVEVLEERKVTTLPVVDFHGKLIGVIRHDALVEAAASEASADMQMMVGVSKDEGALSSIPFSVRKRLPWLQVNLFTAFLAAFVVGIFEGTIARFTALAVLMPVAAGQSGNTGAQALAVTMRGLALREIRIRHWIRVVAKELAVGATNGIAVATVTALSVWVWSRSIGLSLVIALAMVISMVIASAAGALVPIGLTILKQDPAQASSIILTTITDIVGFVSFLGLATLLSGML